MVDPLVHHLRIAKSAEAAEEFARDAAEIAPGGVGVDFLKNGADRAATANGNAKVVNRLRRGVLADGLELLEDPLHGLAETALGSGGIWDGDDGGHARWPSDSNTH